MYAMFKKLHKIKITDKQIGFISLICINIIYKIDLPCNQATKESLVEYKYPFDTFAIKQIKLSILKLNAETQI